MTTSTQTLDHLNVADRTHRAGPSFASPSFADASVRPTTITARPATASVRSTLPAPAREAVRLGAIGGIRPAVIAAVHALAATARRLRASWQAGAAKDALIQEHHDKVRTQIHLFGGRY
ncbi:hypothetical protein [Arthrobacter sp.]|uniref:hypothetical protein n=1 Tax=Arthrobacter sp. TaxID=1667 RepID=UPI003396C0A9